MPLDQAQADASYGVLVLGHKTQSCAMAKLQYAAKEPENPVRIMCIDIDEKQTRF